METSDDVGALLRLAAADDAAESVRRALNGREGVGTAGGTGSSTSRETAR